MRWNVRQMTFAAAVAALYVVMTYFAHIFSWAYGPLQFRFSEALTVLPVLFPASVPGLFIGCLIANVLSPYGIWDVIFGSAATLIAAIWTGRVKNRWLAPLPPVICNGLIVGAVIAWGTTAESGQAFLPAFAFHGGTIALCELAVCYVLGLLLLAALERIPALRPMERGVL